MSFGFQSLSSSQGSVQSQASADHMVGETFAFCEEKSILLRYPLDQEQLSHFLLWKQYLLLLSVTV